VRVVSIGVTPVKGLAHTPRTALDLPMSGAGADRLFCFVDPATRRVLKTVENDTLLACRAEWEPPVLTLVTPAGTVTGEVPPDGGERFDGDYWGRPVCLARVDGPWPALMRRLLGREVVLCRVVSPSGGVVWGGAVSLVTTSSLAEVARRTGRASEDGRRFRATFVVDTGSAPAFVEDSWVGRRLRVGDAEVRVRGRQARCAVVDRRPGAGGRDVEVLKALAVDRRVGGEILFGVDADVDVPGRVAVGARVELLS
jgi:uncharacterized protein YcbX